jgi:hypothetical protein
MELSLYRMALLGEGVRIPCAVTVGGVEVNIPDVRLGRDVPDLFAALLADAQFIPTVDHVMWMTSSAPSRPVFFLTTPWLEGNHPVAATMLLDQILGTVLDTLALAYGGEPRTVGYVVETSNPGKDPRQLVLGVGGLSRPVSQLQRLAPDGSEVAPLDLDQTFQTLSRQPQVALWIRLFAPVAGEGRWDVRVLRLCSLLESIADNMLPAKQPVADQEGVQLLGYDGKLATTDTLRGQLYVLAKDACGALGLPEVTLVANPANSLWEEAGIWADIRNVVAHEGIWRPPPAPTSLPNPRRRVEVAATAAARGDLIDVGLLRYADCVMAATELILRHALMGTPDAR